MNLYDLARRGWPRRVRRRVGDDAYALNVVLGRLALSIEHTHVGKDGRWRFSEGRRLEDAVLAHRGVADPAGVDNAVVKRLLVEFLGP